MGKKNMYLYLPVEVSVRELNAKLLLSIFAAQENFTCIIGKRHELKKKLAFLPSGIVLEKGLDMPGKERMISIYRLSGHHVATVDEEGLVYLDDVYIQRRIRKKAIQLSSMLFAWGERQADLIKKAYPEYASKVLITGNPRTDLLRKDFHHWYTKEADKLREKYGEYILINSSFAIISPKDGHDLYIDKIKNTGYLDEEKDRNFFWGQVDHYKAIFEFFKEMIISISSEFPEKNIIIRPHPSEDREIWNSFTKNLKNVSIVYEGNVLPWVMGAKVMIQSNCQTAVEAHMLGKTSIAYRPVVSNKYDFNVTNIASYQINNLKQLVSFLDDLFNNRKNIKLDDESNKELHQYMYDFDGLFSCQHVVKELKQLAKKKISLKIRILKIFYRFKQYRRVNLRISNLFKNSARYKKYKKREDYRNHKFPDTTVESISDIVSELQNSIDSRCKLSIKQYSKNLFVISNSEK